MERKNFKKSIVLSAALPAATEDISLFIHAVKYAKNMGICVIEYYTKTDEAEQYGDILKQEQLDGIFLAAGIQKRDNINLSSIHSDERKDAVERTKKLIDAGKASGAKAVLITSGKRDTIETNNEYARVMFEESMQEILAYAGDMSITLEPGDEHVDANQLIGSTEKAVSLADSLSDSHSNFNLTMDTSHIAQLGENAVYAIRKAEPYCNHIHFANCILKPRDPLYGDKHPMFGVEHGVYTAADALGIYHHIEQIYSERELTLALEIINRSADQWKMFEEILNRERWFLDL